MLLDPGKLSSGKKELGNCSADRIVGTFLAYCFFRILFRFVTNKDIYSYNNRKGMNLHLCTRRIILIHSVCVLPTSFTWGAKILITRYSTAVLLCLFVILRTAQVLISSAEVLSSCYSLLYPLVASQIFLRSPLATHTEHSPYCTHRWHRHVSKQRAQSYSEPIVPLSSLECYRLWSIVIGPLRITVDYLHLLGIVISRFLIL